MASTQEQRNENNRNYYYRNREKILQRCKEQYTTPEIKEKKNAWYKNWKEENPELYILSRVHSNAKHRKLECNLTIDDIKIPKICPLLGVPLVFGTRTEKDYTPSIDRLDPSKGYIKGNVWIISYKANRMKNDATKEELIYFAKEILKLTQSSRF